MRLGHELYGPRIEEGVYGLDDDGPFADPRGDALY
jgi:hypothetical protein